MRTWRAARPALAAAGILVLLGVMSCTRAPVPVPPILKPQPGSVAGRILGAGASQATGVPVVVYLEALGARWPWHRVSRRSFEIRHHSGQLEPDFLVARVGDRVVFRNDDEIFHNVFSSSTTQSFDLGILKRGEHRAIELANPGAIPLYSTLHEDLTGLIFVAPTGHYTVVDGDRYRLDAVPAGRFLLRVWSERHRALAREVRISAGETLTLDLRLEQGS